MGEESPYIGIVSSTSDGRPFELACPNRSDRRSGSPIHLLGLLDTPSSVASPSGETARRGEFLVPRVLRTLSSVSRSQTMFFACNGRTRLCWTAGIWGI